MAISFVDPKSALPQAAPVATAPPPRRTDVGRVPLTVGVEEEFLILDPHSGTNMPVADEVVDALPAVVRDQARREVRRSMVEMVTPVSTGTRAVRRRTRRSRCVSATSVPTSTTRFWWPHWSAPSRTSGTASPT